INGKSNSIKIAQKALNKARKGYNNRLKFISLQHLKTSYIKRSGDFYELRRFTRRILSTARRRWPYGLLTDYFDVCGAIFPYDSSTNEASKRSQKHGG